MTLREFQRIGMLLTAVSTVLFNQTIQRDVVTSGIVNVTTAIGAHSDHNRHYGNRLADLLFEEKPEAWPTRGSNRPPEMDGPSRICGVRDPIWQAEGAEAKIAEKKVR
jgi:hypothetical protein